MDPSPESLRKRPVLERIVEWLAAARRSRARAEVYRRLADYEDRLLNDVGLRRADLLSAARRSAARFETPNRTGHPPVAGITSTRPKEYVT